jgi:uncharacterized Tic20 family protein
MTTPSDPSSGPAQEPAPGYGYGPPPGWGPPPGQAGPWSTTPWAGGHGAGPPSGDDTTWAVLTHLSYFVVGLIAPLVVYLVKKDSSPFVRQHAAEALNFHLTLLIAFVVSAVLVIVLIGLLLLFVVFLVGAVFSVIAAIAAGKGEQYRYPMTIRFVS